MFFENHSLKTVLLFLFSFSRHDPIEVRREHGFQCNCGFSKSSDTVLTISDIYRNMYVLGQDK